MSLSSVAQEPMLRLRGRSSLILSVASLAGLVMLMWPLLVRAPEGSQMQPPFLFVALLPLVLVVVLAEMSEGGMDSRVLALLGVLTAINAVLRGVSAGTAGVELVFFLLIVAGRVFGPGFGFVLGCTSLFASALVTAGVGPWLPYQMLVSAWVGMGAGLLPFRKPGQISARAELAMLVAYGVFAAYAFGLLMNLSSWPFVLGIEVPGVTSQLSFVPGDPLIENLQRFGVYTLVTSTGSWDTGRAITTSIALIVLGPAILTTLRRASRRVVVTRTSRASRGSETQGRISRIRSSPAEGSPRPSRFDVVTQRLPSGATTTVRSRPYFPTKKPLGLLGLVARHIDPPEPFAVEGRQPERVVQVGQGRTGRPPRCSTRPVD